MQIKVDNIFYNLPIEAIKRYIRFYNITFIVTCFGLLSRRMNLMGNFSTVNIGVVLNFSVDSSG